MTRLPHFTLLAAAAALLLAGPARADVSAQEAEQLKTTLTPFGAEKAGNKDGSIPAWTGGLTQPIKRVGRRPFWRPADVVAWAEGGGRP